MHMPSKLLVAALVAALAACAIDTRSDALSSVLGGTVTGLEGVGLVLINQSGANLEISQNGEFAFDAPLERGASYGLAVARQPSNPTQECAIANGTGVAGDGDVTDVLVSCSTRSFLVGGTVTGLAGAGLVLRNNAGDDLAIAGDGAFVFPTPVASGATYSVRAAAQPAQQACPIVAGTGTVGGRDVSSIQVRCRSIWEPAMFPIPVPGAVAGAGDLALDGNNDLLVMAVAPAGAIVRVDHVTGERIPIASSFGPGFLYGVAYRAANDMIYASTDFGLIFAVTPAGAVATLTAVPSGLNAIAIAPASFGSFGGFIIGVTPAGQVVAVNPTGGAVTTIAASAGPASDLAFAPDGTLYICGGTTVRTVTATGKVRSFAGGFASADGITITPDGTRMFIADSGTDTVRQVTIARAVVTTVGPADIDDGAAVGGILAAPGNTLVVMTGETSLTLTAFPY
jgi:6-phosphogluconolactonase